MKQAWPIICVVLAGFGAFGASFALLRPAEGEPQNPVAAVEAPRPAEAPAVPAAAAAFEEAPMPRLVPRKPAPQPRSLVLGHWQFPVHKTAKGEIDDDYRLHDIVFESKGRWLITVSKGEAHVFNPETRRITRTFRSPYRGLPDATGILASPDGRFIATAGKSHWGEAKSITLHDVASGRVIGGYKPGEDERFDIQTDPFTFTPGGEYLLISVHGGGERGFRVISTRNGAARMLKVPGGSKEYNASSVLAVAPALRTIVCNQVLRGGERNPSEMVALNLATGQARQLTSLSIRPHTFFSDKPFQLSPDGTRVLVKDLENLQVCDWQQNKLLYHWKRSSAMCGNPRFTPDGRRCLVVWRYNQGRTSGFVPVDTRANQVVLIDIDGRQQIADYNQRMAGFDPRIHAIGISHDGKTLAVGHETSLTLLDFKEAFGVDPLPPGRRAPDGPLPVR